MYSEALQDAIDEGIVCKAHLIAGFDDVHQGSTAPFWKECFGLGFFQDEVPELLKALHRAIQQTNFIPCVQQVGNWKSINALADAHQVKHWKVMYDFQDFVAISFSS